MKWPTKYKREEYEIEGFIKAYEKLYNQKILILQKQERPDYILKNLVSNTLISVELTSVYIDDKSVPMRHKRTSLIDISYNPDLLSWYKKRICQATLNKIEKAKSGYELSEELFLSVYINEYEAIYMDDIKDWLNLVDMYQKDLPNLYPFNEVIFWNLVEGHIFSISSNFDYKWI